MGGTARGGEEGLDPAVRSGVQVLALVWGVVSMQSSLTTMLNESHRTRLIGEIVSMLRQNSVPPETRAAGLTLIGWLARRMPNDEAAVAPRPVSRTSVPPGPAHAAAGPVERS